jgi:hypothetical protein
MLQEVTNVPFCSLRTVTINEGLYPYVRSEYIKEHSLIIEEGQFRHRARGMKCEAGPTRRLNLTTHFRSSCTHLRSSVNTGKAASDG